jgi:hypothetical protein
MTPQTTVLQFIESDMLLFRQGVIWLMIATVAEVPLVVSVAKFECLPLLCISMFCPRCLLLWI